jgi:cytosine/creatinine deaminase
MFNLYRELLMQEFMDLAYQQALKSYNEGGLPIGSVLVRDGKIISSGHNLRVQNDDPLAHAEMVCLKNAGRIKSYKGCTIYSTLMPCYMCSGTIVQFGIKELIVGENKNFEGGKEFMEQHGVNITILNDDNCTKLMSKFIEENPELWNEDIGLLD